MNGPTWPNPHLALAAAGDKSRALVRDGVRSARQGRGPSRPRRRGRGADLIFTAGGRGARKLTAEWCQNWAAGSRSKAAAFIRLGGVNAASINGVSSRRRHGTINLDELLSHLLISNFGDMEP